MTVTIKGDANLIIAKSGACSLFFIQPGAVARFENSYFYTSLSYRLLSRTNRLEQLVSVMSYDVPAIQRTDAQGNSAYLGNGATSLCAIVSAVYSNPIRVRARVYGKTLPETITAGYVVTNQTVTKLYEKDEWVRIGNTEYKATEDIYRTEMTLENVTLRKVPQ